MKNLSNLFHNLLWDDSGQDMIEYALVAGIIATGAVSIMGTVAGDIVTLFTNLGTKLTTPAT